MKPIKLLQMLTFLGVLTVSLLAPGPVNAQTTLFESVDSSQWVVNGRVQYLPTDTTLTFLFDFDDANPPVTPPDTVLLDIVQEISLLNCSSAYISFSTADSLPTQYSWVAGDVIIYARHEYQPDWFEVYEDISNLAGTVEHLMLRFKVAVSTHEEYPGFFRLYNIRVTGSCGP